VLSGMRGWELYASANHQLFGAGSLMAKPF